MTRDEIKEIIDRLTDEELAILNAILYILDKNSTNK